MLCLPLFLVTFNIYQFYQSFKCDDIQANNCTDCDGLNTNRILSSNECLCEYGFFDNGFS